MARTTRPRPAVLPPLPADVRLMNGVASVVFVLAAVGAVVAGVAWLMRSPIFPIRAIQLDGDLVRNSVPTIRANAAPLLAGNFFSIDLQQGRSAFERVPWVRRAVVRRIWPDRLAVKLEEHQAVALWEAEDGDSRLVNSFGEVFEANVGDVEDDSLPIFSGPSGSAAQMLALHQRLHPVLAGLDLEVMRMTLSSRGSWHLELDSGAELELGRGNVDEVVARTERFARTYAQVAAKWSNRPLEYADLRHVDGYAVRLRGVSTATAAAAAGPRTAARAAVAN